MSCNSEYSRPGPYTRRVTIAELARPPRLIRSQDEDACQASLEAFLPGMKSYAYAEWGAMQEKEARFGDGRTRGGALAIAVKRTYVPSQM